MTSCRHPRGRSAPLAAPRALVLAALLAASPRAHADYPIASHRHLADPAALVHGGRVYLYASNDDDNVGDDGYEMSSLVCISSSDLKNWTDHGEVFRVPRDASWATRSWAPAVVARNDRVYIYFGNSGSGIGVASSTSPTGPFTDAKGGYLVNASTPGASGTNSWLFDPAVFIDDDGQAYLYFGGNGEANARVIRLNDDMVSVSGSAIALSVPYFFEAAWLHKRNGTYYFSYSTNPENGLRIDYLTSSSPTSGFEYRGTVADQPPSNNNNNHAAIFEFGGVYYHAYHNRYVALEQGEPPGYLRNLAIERLEHEDDGTIRQVTYTTDGVPQIAYVNPYLPVEAETFNAQSGIETEPCSEGGMNVSYVEDGDWILVRGVDFGNAGAVGFSARVASAASGGNIELRLGEPTGTLIGTCTVPGTGDWQTWTSVSCPVTGATGVADLYLRFAGGDSTLFNVNSWQFTAADGAGGGGSGGQAGTGGSAPGGGAPAGGLGGIGAGSSTGGSTAGSGGSTTAGTGGAATGGAATGGAATGGASAGGVSGSGAAQPSMPSDSDTGGGCSCRSASGSSRAAWLGLLPIAAIALWSRRRAGSAA